MLELHSKILKMEQHTAGTTYKWNVMTEENGEKWEGFKTKVLDILKDKLEIEDATMERVTEINHFKVIKISKVRLHLGQYFINCIYPRIKPGFYKSVIA